jgi:transcription-repair coupling factor (superfamily II helicase)
MRQFKRSSEDRSLTQKLSSIRHARILFIGRTVTRGNRARELTSPPRACDVARGQSRIWHPLAIDLFQQVSNTPVAQELRRRVEEGTVLPVTGFSAGAQSFLATLLREWFPERPLVIVVAGIKRQEIFHQDVTSWLNWRRANSKAQSEPETVCASKAPPQPHFYPAWEVLPHESKLPHADVISERLETLVALDTMAESKREPPLIVTNVVALMQRTFSRQEIAKRTRLVRRGDAIDPLDLVEWLEDQGYEPEAKVTQKGEISLRGGILDVFPPVSPWPVRLEFFGNEVDSLRHFDPNSQISREPIEHITFTPAGELALLKNALDASDPVARIALASLVDHLPASTLWLLCEPDLLEEQAQAYAQQVPASDPFLIAWGDLLEEVSTRDMTSIAVSESAGDTAGPEPAAEVDNTRPGKMAKLRSYALLLPFASLEAFRPLSERAVEPPIAEAQRREFFSQMHRWLRQGYGLLVFCNNQGEQERFTEIWQEYGLGNLPREEKASDPQPEDAPRPALTLGALARGFVFEPGQIVVVTDAEIFGRYKVQRPRRLKSPHAIAARSALDIDFTDLEEGDFVVHLQHGIGRYRGLQIRPRGGGRKGSASAAIEPEEADEEELGQECLVVEYAPNEPDQPPPRLYVPVTEAHLVSKYVGAGKARPALHTLGGTRWAKAKLHAERAVRDLASDLLSIQAARESQAGHAFAADTSWQREFEGAFLYEETPDQLRAIVDTKRDLETPRPMDRLICGDVGYGKTEVAIRAAFKAVMGGKQVALLVPTTILAQQHFNTFRERMADYPIRIEQLSRFCSRREQNRIIRQLAEGSVDIVIGTHRLIQEDIGFKDLGLVIIDEEQRFGVLHKEKFKLLRKLVDVLTLSATPIPRTLYLALTGARDMSTIETPPQDRLPVETVVAQYDERLIRDAVQRELNRQGQVYYLHNRILDIESVALRVKALVPNAKVVVGHGQMDSDALEEVMAQFINGQADVLVSTTIIESGIDIPNANTIIIERADRYGLSDLYQLRGRVGRYKHQAYAYLLLPRHAALLSDVRKRITAIKQYSSLGSGFKIAMRDLEIRGAGNLLGAQQSGHITAVGFELYCQLLKQSVSALKGEKVNPRVEVTLRIDFLALDPSEERSAPEPEEALGGLSSPLDPIRVPREVASYVQVTDRATREPKPVQCKGLRRAAAYIPFSYIREPQQRIEIYRKLAQVTDKASLDRLEGELRDRYGKISPAVELLLSLAELKFLAAERGITVIETKADRVMLTRNNDYITVSGKFPRLTKKEARARLKELKKLILAL